MSSLMNNYRRSSLSFSSGTGVMLRGTDGKRYLDFLSGIAVNPLGHRHPTILRALRRAMEHPLHVSNLYQIPEQQELARRLSKLSGGRYRAFFANSGAEATEAALKLARKATKRTRFLCFTHAFHGRTFGALSMTPKEEIQKPFAPLLFDRGVLEYNSFEDLKKIDRRVAAVIVECIQGEGGLLQADLAWLRELRKITKKMGVMLIVDEVQTGIGRTGTFFCFQQYGIQPDMITVAKGLGGGVPIGALLATEKVAEHFTPGSHGSTFGGNPLVCRVALAVINVIGRKSFIRKVGLRGNQLREGLKKIMAEFPGVISGIRGRGLMLGVEFSSAELAKAVFKSLQQEHHILANVTADTVLRLLPPLIVRKEHIRNFLTALHQSVSDCSRGMPTGVALRIRWAAGDDLDQICALHKANSSPRYMTEEGTPYLRPLSRSTLRRLVPRTLLLTEADELIGKIHYEPAAGFRRCVLAGGLAVASRIQRAGHAMRLVEGLQNALAEEGYQYVIAVSAAPHVESLLEDCDWKDGSRKFSKVLRKARERYVPEERRKARLFMKLLES